MRNPFKLLKKQEQRTGTISKKREVHDPAKNQQIDICLAKGVTWWSLKSVVLIF